MGLFHFWDQNIFGQLNPVRLASGASIALRSSLLGNGIEMHLTSLRQVCNRFKDCAKEFYVEPIPVQKLNNARKRLKLSAETEVAALIDFTVFGSATDALAVTTEGLHWKNIADPAPLSIPWVVLQRLTYREYGILTNNIEFSNGLKIDLNGAATLNQKSNHSMLELLDAFKTAQLATISDDSSVGASEATGVDEAVAIDDGFIDCEFCKKRNKPEVTFCKSCGIKLRG